VALSYARGSLIEKRAFLTTQTNVGLRSVGRVLHDGLMDMQSQGQQAIAQIDTLLAEVEKARNASQYDDLSGGLPDDEMRQIHTRLRAAIDRLSAPGSRYAQQADKVEEHGFVGNQILDLGGILQAMRADFDAGYIQTFEELVHSSVFEDFLDMATELRAKGYKDPAAVIAGSVLEEHVRSLASRNGIGLIVGKRPQSVDELLIALVKAGQFSETRRKIAASWYGIRTDAAHGRYVNVEAAEVERMISGIRDFMSRFPA
jgi:hypothetical protein